MIILFSPSENKQIPTSQTFAPLTKILFFESEYKQKALKAYIKALCSSDENLICKLFGTKYIDLDSLALCQNLLTAPTLPAIKLYNGVAYKALDIENLPLKAQDFIFKNVYICSNLFGFVRANDSLPFYKLHQGSGIGDFSLKTIYNAQKSDMDALLAKHDVLDLRAEIYIKTYPLTMPHTQVVFLKNGKKLSHASKLYRGLYLRHIALQNSTFDNLDSQNIENLTLTKSTTTAYTTTLTYEIC